MEFLKDYFLLIILISILTEGIKMRIPAEKLHPKWTSLFVAIILSGFYTQTENFDGDYLNLLLSFGLAIILYDYVIKIVVDKVKILIQKYLDK